MAARGGGRARVPALTHRGGFQGNPVPTALGHGTKGFVLQKFYRESSTRSRAVCIALPVPRRAVRAHGGPPGAASCRLVHCGACFYLAHAPLWWELLPLVHSKARARRLFCASARSLRGLFAAGLCRRRSVRPAPAVVGSVAGPGPVTVTPSPASSRCGKRSVRRTCRAAVVSVLLHVALVWAGLLRSIARVLHAFLI